MKRKYNWRPDKPDIRDWKFSTEHRELIKLPPSVNLSPICPPIFDQGQLGSCTSQALAGNLDYLEERNNETNPKAYTDLSRLFIYYNERVIEGTTKQDAGAELRDGIKALVKYGTCPESLWTYTNKNLFKKPTTAAYKAALNSKITSYSRITTLDDMKNCLAAHYPFVFGFTVYDYFESDEMAKKGILKMPKASESVLGGHAVLCVGYNDKTKRMLVRNSWGKDWGLGGYFWMPYEYISNTNLADDMWSIRK